VGLGGGDLRVPGRQRLTGQRPPRAGSLGRSHSTGRLSRVDPQQRTQQPSRVAVRERLGQLAILCLGDQGVVDRGELASNDLHPPKRL